MLEQSVSRKYPFDPADRMMRSVEHRDNIYRDPGRVTFTSSQYVTAISRKHGKRWWRWQTSGVITIYRSKNGFICGRRKSGKFWVSEIPWVFADSNFSRLVEEEFGPVTVERVFPLAEHFNVQYPKGRASRGLREQNIPDMTRVLFGKTRFRKDLAKAVAQADISHIAIAMQFNGLVPIDWIVHFLRNSRRGYVNGGFVATNAPIRKALLSLDPRSYRHLLLNEAVNVARYAGDIWRMHTQQFPRENNYFRSWREWHDAYGGRAWHTVVPQTNLEFPETEWRTKFAGVSVENYQFILPKDTDELASWGEYMGNCIGSYRYTVNNPDVLLGGIRKGDKIIANFEVNAGRLNQLLGRFNRPLDVDTRKALESAFESRGINVAGYWGSD